MTADEMFKEIGYTLTSNSDYIVYEKNDDLYGRVKISLNDDLETVAKFFYKNNEWVIIEFDIEDIAPLQKLIKERFK